MKSCEDDSMFIRKDGTHIAILLVYVDDFIITGDDHKAILSLKNLLQIKVAIILNFLGIEVSRSREGIVLTQLKYITRIF